MTCRPFWKAWLYAFTSRPFLVRTHHCRFMDGLINWEMLDVWFCWRVTGHRAPPPAHHDCSGFTGCRCVGAGRYTRGFPHLDCTPHLTAAFGVCIFRSFLCPVPCIFRVQRSGFKLTILSFIYQSILINLHVSNNECFGQLYQFSESITYKIHFTFITRP